MGLIEDFFRDIDRRWALPHADRIRLRIIGSTALMLREDYTRITKDSDVIETTLITGAVKEHLLSLAPRSDTSDIYLKYRMYLDVVPPGLAFLPQPPACHLLTNLNQELMHLELEVLDVVDVVVSKLKRYSANDRHDIQAMVDRDLVDDDVLVERFKAAIDAFLMDARAAEIPEIIERFHDVQYNMLMTSKTPIERPDFLD